jgi:hypothetical protein
MAKPKRTQFERALVGPAGEHYVLFRLYREGFLASLAPPGSPTVDVLVLSPDETIIASLQVKTRTYGRDQGWHMSKKTRTSSRRGFSMRSSTSNQRCR